ncbi:MAG: glycosyl hydrolase family 88 [Oscillospiraceae bacterium]|nr:glycosyl hydrolase family 88 [Oscillospiraceae bacterium]
MGRSQNRKKYINKKKKSNAKRKKEGRIVLIIALVAVLLIVAAVVIFFMTDEHERATLIDLYDEKADLLRTEVSTDPIDGDKMASGTPARVVFISVCNGLERAKVFTGTGTDSLAAFNNANNLARAFVETYQYNPLWLKADIVNSSQILSTEEFSVELKHWRHEFFRRGISFDMNFRTALLESELNGAKILEYEEECVDFNYLNTYLKKADRSPLTKLPDEYVVFSCDSWFCDDDSTVFELNNSGYEYGRRDIELIDSDFASEVVTTASGFLVDQVQANGSFVYGIYPRFDRDIDNYNIVRHASTLWSLVCQFKMTDNPELIPVIDRAVDYMVNNYIVYSDDNTAYLLEQKSNEIKLGGCGVAVVALTEYMDALKSTKYKELCVALGNGILNMMDENTGEYYHVLNGDFSRKEAFRVVYYDGEASFALCKLYGLTRDQKWLDAVETAVNHFIEADYTIYKDHWIAYTMNELTKYVDKEEYYAFALRNAQVNLDTIYNRDTTYHTYFELLMATFEVYDRMVDRGIEVEYAKNFDLNFFLKTIYARADRLLDGYFFPEYAMYMQNPQRILNTFMVRHDGYRVRIDDVQHSVGGYYLYYENYDKLVEYGLLECRDK